MKMGISDEQRERLERLAASGESGIDTSDIPKVLDWSGAMRPGLDTAGKEAITIRLDADVLAWFRARTAGGSGYQSEINRVLRRHVASQRRA